MSNENGPVERRPEPRKTVPWVWIVITAALAVAVIALLLANRFGSRVTEFDRPEPPKGPNIVATTTEPPPIAPPVVTTEPPPPKPTVKAPLEVLRYVLFVQAVTSYRYGLQTANVEYVRKLAQGPAGQLGKAQDANDLLDKLEELAAQSPQQFTAEFIGNWQKLMRWFQSVPPPAECQALHDSYLDALRAVAVSYSNYEARQASDPFGMAIKIGGLAKTTSAEVDAKFDNADTELRTLRAKYPDLPQFTIGGDPPAAGSLLDQPQTPNR